MIELKPDEFADALPLLSRIPQAVIPQAVCEGINPGRIYVDRREHPRIAFLWTPVGYYFLAGHTIYPSDLAGLAEPLTDVFIPASLAGGESSFILIPSPEIDRAHIQALLGGRKTIQIYRRPFAFDPSQYAQVRRQLPPLPEGLRLQRVDAALAERCGLPPSWVTVDNFIAHGTGFALMAGDEIASLCQSIFASRQRVEIDLHTRPEYRRRGFAALTACALIDDCLRQGRLPNWECFWDNQPSINLAGKLGFLPEPDYPVYYWEEGEL